MQASRQIEIIYTLLEKGKVTAQELAKKFDVSTRTIYRDIENLTLANIPVTMEKGFGGGISLMEGYTLNKAMLTENEKMEIMSALSALSAVEIEKNQAISKLSSIFGGNNYNWIEVDFANWHNERESENKFETLKNAILQKSLITFDYISTFGDHTTRKVAPLKLCFKGQGWYLFAYCYEKCDYRFFKLTRLNNLNSLNERHQLTPPKRVLQKQEFSSGETIKVRLKLDKSQGARAYDEFGSISPDEKGNYIVEMTYPKVHYLYNYILSFGEHCEILEPKELKEEIKDYLKKTLKNYF